MKKFFIPICCLFLSFVVQAQDLNFKNFTPIDGLPSTEVYDIFQDKNGCMWFATDRGIAQYNGYEFKSYETAHGLTDICVFDFFLQPNGQVWCTTYNNQLFFFENGKNKFFSYKYNKVIEKYLKGLRSNAIIIKRILVDTDQSVYITDYNHTFKIDAKGKLTVFENKEKYNNKDSFFLHTLKLKNNKKIDFFTSKNTNFYTNLNPVYRIGIVNLSPHRKFIMNYYNAFMFNNNHFFKDLTLPNFEPIDCGNYKKNLFWIGYRANGVKILNVNGVEKQHLLKEHSVTKLLVDCYEGIWVSTLDAGVFYLKKNLLQTSNLKDLSINSLCVDHKDNLLVGGFDGNVYSKNYSGKSYQTILQSINNTPAFVNYLPSSQQTYFTSNHKLYYNDNSFDLLAYIKTTDDKDNPFITLIDYGQIILFNVRSNYIKKILYRTKVLDVSIVKNQYFVGTLFGLKKLYHNKEYAFKNNLLKSRIEDIDFDKQKQTLYMASLGKGVLVYNLKKNKVFSIDKSKGLSSNLVNEVYIQNENTIWACTNYGLNKINFNKKGQLKVEYITAANGLPNDQVKKVLVFKDSIYIGTSKGLSSLAINDFDNLFKNKKYFLRLKKVTVNNKEVNLQDKLELKHNQNNLSFFVEGVSFSSNRQISYKYKLQGLDKEWYYTKHRKITYQNIPPGTYTLKVQIVEDNNLLSNEEINFPIVVFKPFWKTNSFIAFEILLFGALIYLFFKIRVLTYNVDVVRELIRLLLKRLTKKEFYFKFKEQGKDNRIKTREILYIKSYRNYIEIVTTTNEFTIREKIGDFISMVPDPLEFIRIHRSYIVRIDQVDKKTKDSVFIKGIEIPVGRSYLDALDKIIF